MFQKMSSSIKVLFGFMIISLILNQMILGVKPAYAQQESVDQVVFSQLYSGVRVLRGPLDSTSMGFQLPAHWSTPTGGELRLGLSVVLFGATLDNTSNRNFKAIVQVSLNNEDLGSVIVDQEGPQVATFPIPASAWVTVNSNRVNDMTIQFTSNDECGGASILTIDSSSILAIPHSTVLPATDLRALPWPLFQDSIYPDLVTIVVPDNPSTGTLGAALSVAAGMGRMTTGKLQLQTLTSSALTDSVMQKSNLIFVGKPGEFSQIDTIEWPGQPNGDFLGIPGTNSDDGILQMVVSPWNQSKVVLWVSGGSDTGINKAGKSVGSGVIRTGVQSNLAVVSDTNSNVTPDILAIDTTVANLGYADELRLGEGPHSVDYFFDIPYNQTANEDGYINLYYANSALLDFGQSGFTIDVNGQNIGSGRFTERSTSISNLTITIPGDTILPGRNRISIFETLRFTDICSQPLDNDVWAVIRPESMIHIPLGPASATVTTSTLDQYPAMFGPTLSRTAFILSPADPLSLSIAAATAYDIGISTQGTLISPEVVYDDNISDLVLKERDIIVIGIPSELRVMDALNANMPAPFPDGSNIASEPANELKFRLPDDTPSGYVEIFQSPWNSERIVLALLGNDAIGLRSAQAALLNPALRFQLKGNLAVVYGDYIYSSVTAQATSQPVTVIVPATPIPTTSSLTNIPSQTNLIVIGVTAIVVFILAGIIIFLQRRRTPQK